MEMLSALFAGQPGIALFFALAVAPALSALVIGQSGAHPGHDVMNVARAGFILAPGFTGRPPLLALVRRACPFDGTARPA